MQSAAMGTLPTIRAAVDPNAKGGQYYFHVIITTQSLATTISQRFKGHVQTNLPTLAIFDFLPETR